MTNLQNGGTLQIMKKQTDMFLLYYIICSSFVKDLFKHLLK